MPNEAFTKALQWTRCSNWNTDICSYLKNPKNAAVPIVIPARQAVKFTPGKKMRRLIEEEEAMLSTGVNS